jgi:hypothetical protein
MSDQMSGNEPAAADGAGDGLAPATPIAETAVEGMAAAAPAAAQTDSVVTRVKTIASSAPSELTSRAKGMLEDVAPAEAAGAAAAWAAAQTGSVVGRAKTIASTAPSEMTSRAKGMLKESAPSPRGVGWPVLLGAVVLGLAYLLYRRAKAGDQAGAAAA